MKRKILALTIMAACSAQSLMAQKGGILLYGDFGFMSTTEKEDVGSTTVKDKETTYIFSPGIGYGISDNFVVGLNIGVAGNVFKPDGGNKKTNTGFMVGPFARYTKKFGDVFSFYGQGNLSYVGGKNEYDNGLYSSSYKTSGVILNINPNIGIDVGKGWALDFGFGSLGYSSITETNDDDEDDKSTNNEFGLLLNANTLRWGVSYMFNCNKKE